MASVLEGWTPWPREFVDRYWAAGHWRGNTLDNLLRGWALQYGPRTALVHGDTRITYAHLNRRADRRAAGFRLRGIRPGMRVVVQLPNVPEFVVTVFALMRAGAVPVLCPLAQPADALPETVRVTQAVGYVGPAAHADGEDRTAEIADIAARWPFLRRVFTLPAPGGASPYGGLTTDPAGCQYSELSTVDAAPEPALVQGSDQVAFLMAADGAVTGPRPLLVPRTHDDYAYQARAAAAAVSLTADDVHLVALPAESALALGCPGIIGTLSVGGTVVLAEDPGPDTCLTALTRERVTVASVAPGALRRWLDALPGSGADTRSLRLVQTGGGEPLDRATAGRVGAALGCPLQEVHGGPEGPLVLTRPSGDPLTARGRLLSPDDEVRVVDANGADVPDGTRGALLARGPYTPRGYYRAPDHDRRRFTPDGWFRTGDLVRRAPDGSLERAGRAEGAGAARA
ncbi:AMP-binding protein [Streptomyces sp. NPDC004311]|uniref:AMP-binding protein n=1 Tax=Streptomyces sp. NPDC004311 TaxID=3364698 RepID=UPI00367C2AF1